MGGGWHEAMVLVYLPLAVCIGPSPLLILTLCGSERVLVVSTEPLDDLSWLTPGGGGGRLPTVLMRPPPQLFVKTGGGGGVVVGGVGWGL